MHHEDQAFLWRFSGRRGRQDFFPPQNWQMSKWKNRYFPMSVSPKYLELVRLEEAGGKQITSVDTTV
jgi:hypothetical protein